MTAFLPPNLLALFAARDPIPYVPPVDKLSHEKKRNGYGGVSMFLKEFEDPKDTPPPTRVETKDERKERKRKERAEQIAYKLEQDLALWDPHSQNTSTDPYRTLFVARINYDTSESKIRREFEVYGPIRKIKISSDKGSGKPRGYAFIEYEHERDMHSAYKHADGKKIDGRRVLVDVERGRTVKGWRPRRLGGGLGGTRKGGPDENTRFSGRDDYSTRSENFRGGDRERDRGEREASPARERDRGERPERRKRSRSRERDRGADRETRRRRSRSRDRKREKEAGPAAGGEEEEKASSDRKKRSRRSRSRDRSKRRSRSRDRKRSKRSRSKDKKPKDDQQDQQPAGEGYEVGEYPEEGPVKPEQFDGGDGGEYGEGEYSNGGGDINTDEGKEGQYEEYKEEGMVQDN